MKHILIILSLFSSFILTAQHQFDWVKSIGSTAFDSGLGVAIDAHDDIITVGTFAGTADFDSGSGMINLSPIGGSDAYIHKMDQYGNTLWALSLGSHLDDEARAVDVDDENNIYVSGNFLDTMLIGNDTLISSGQTDIFLLKLDPEGNFIWAKNYGGAGADNAQVLDVRADFGVHLGGDYRTSFDFDPGVDTVIVPNVNGPDAFVMKTNLDGEFQWVRTFGGASGDYTEGVGVMSDGSVVAIGNFRDTIDFNPGPLVAQQVALGNDVFIVKLDEEGEFLWSKKIGLNSEDLARDMSIDHADNILITGEFKSTFDFDPSPANYILQTNGIADVFFCKYDSDGNFIWADHIGDTSNDAGYAIRADADNGVHITGFFFGTVDVNTGPDSLMFSSGGTSRDAFVLSLNEDGSFLQGHQITGTADEYGFAIGLDSNQDIVTSGRFHGLTDFNPDSTASYVNNNGAAPDAFILNLSDCPTVYASAQDTACSSYSFIGETLLASGTYTGSTVSSNGCDSIITLDLVILNASDTLIAQSACDTVEVNGSNYTMSGMYTQSFQNISGCDSLVHIDVDILSSTSVQELTACFEYQHNGQLLNQSGQYIDTLTSAQGCDSILILDLNIMTVDTALIANDPMLTASALDASYQWIDCLDQTAVLMGDTLAVFEATYNSEFALIVEQGGCVDTSSCYAITSIGLDENHLLGLHLFPNPTEDDIFFSIPSAQGLMTIEVRDLMGRLVQTQHGMGDTIDMSNVPKGTYSLRFQLGEFEETRLITKR